MKKAQMGDLSGRMKVAGNKSNRRSSRRVNEAHRPQPQVSEEAYLDEMLRQTFPASDPLPYEPMRRGPASPPSKKDRGD